MAGFTAIINTKKNRALPELKLVNMGSFGYESAVFFQCNRAVRIYHTPVIPILNLRAIILHNQQV